MALHAHPLILALSGYSFPATLVEESRQCEQAQVTPNSACTQQPLLNRKLAAPTSEKTKSVPVLTTLSNGVVGQQGWVLPAPSGPWQLATQAMELVASARQP